MNSLNFTAMDILPSLLDERKDQTIRPGWDKNGNPKPARFKVGEPAQLMWHQRSSCLYFCKKCGIGSVDDYACPKCGSWDLFDKYIRKVKITEVFGILMRKEFGRVGGNIQVLTGIPDLKTHNLEGLAKRDGFNCVGDFLNYFDSHYDLKQAKPFWVYRWG